MREETDILIVGGGLVGTSLAIALDQQGRDATLVEAFVPKSTHQPPDNERNLALARASVNGLKALGVWPYASDHAHPVHRVHVSRAGSFGATRLDSASQGVDALGWTVPASKLGAALAQRLQTCRVLQRRVPAKVMAIERDGSGWQVTLETEQGSQTIHTRLLVGADGTRSMVRDGLGIMAASHDYAQTLFVAAIHVEQKLDDRAFERFTDDGPVALLPLGASRAGLVLTVNADEAEQVANLDDETFLRLAQHRFGWRVGRFMRMGKRFRHPIQRVASNEVVASRGVLVGNAAQTIHPVGAQGFNLGLRDALTLAEMTQGHDDPGASTLLDAYAERRQPDREGVMAMSHGLIRLACLDVPWLAPLHSVGLLANDRLPFLRRILTRHGMGFRAKVPQAVLEEL